MFRSYLTSPLFPYTTLFRSGYVEFFVFRDISTARFVPCVHRMIASDNVLEPLARYHKRCINLKLQAGMSERARSEEHTSELQSRGHLVCRLLLEKKTIGTQL